MEKSLFLFLVLIVALPMMASANRKKTITTTTPDATRQGLCEFYFGSCSTSYTDSCICLKTPLGAPIFILRWEVNFLKIIMIFSFKNLKNRKQLTWIFMLLILIMKRYFGIIQLQR